jgi:hypothetical protein
MDHTFPVTVVDHAAAAVAGATAVIVDRSTLPAAAKHPFETVAATHTDQGAGRYQETAKIVPANGNWILIVSLAGKSPVVQPLKWKSDKAGEFTTTPAPAAVATVTITAATRTIAGVQQREIAFHVVLHPAAELAFMSGVDYHKSDVGTGWMFHHYAFNRAEVLRREKKIDPGTVVTVFATPLIQRITRVWGGKKWVDIEVLQLGDPKTRVPAHPYQPVAGLDIHINDFYQHLHAVGSRAPRSIIEAGIFSHSWPGGPILYNTSESAAHAALGAARDPNDFDARAKDFNALNFPAHAKMADALAASCRFTIWGCSATTHLKFRARAALKSIKDKKPEDDFFRVTTEIFDDHTGAVVRLQIENTSELRHRFLMDKGFRSASYAAEAAAKLGIEVRAGCPGTGSDPVKVDGIEMLMVNLATYSGVFGYYHEKFAPEFAETKSKWDQGYIDYHALQSRPAVPMPAFDSQYFNLSVVKDVPGSANLSFWDPARRITHPTGNVTISIRGVTDLATVGKKGHLIILKDTDDAKSQAVFVQEDQKFFHVERDAKKLWTVLGAPF